MTVTVLALVLVITTSTEVVSQREVPRARSVSQINVHVTLVGRRRVCGVLRPQRRVVAHQMRNHAAADVQNVPFLGEEQRPELRNLAPFSGVIRRVGNLAQVNQRVATREHRL